MDRRIVGAFRALIGRNRSGQGGADWDSAHHDSAVVARSSTVQRSLQLRVRSGRGLTRALAAVAVGASFIVLSPCSASANSDTGDSDIVDLGPALAPAAPRQQGWVQPRAREFAAPYSKPDVSPESARAVDRLYDELMHGAPPKCSRAAIHAPRGDRC
jgi:hypothetical protein